MLQLVGNEGRDKTRNDTTPTPTYKKGYGKAKWGRFVYEILKMVMQRQSIAVACCSPECVLFTGWWTFVRAQLSILLNTMHIMYNGVYKGASPRWADARLRLRAYP